MLADRVAHGRLLSSIRLTQRLPGARGRSPRQLFRAWRYYVQGGLVPYRLHAELERRRARRLADAGWLRPDAFALLVDMDTSLDWKRIADGPRWWTHKAYLLTRSREYVRIADYLRERAAMAGLEAAPPLLDVDLVEAALRIPPEIEFDPDTDRPLIRRATRGILPDSVRLSVRKSNLAPFYLETASGRDLAAMRAVLTARDLRIGPSSTSRRCATSSSSRRPRARMGSAGRPRSGVWRRPSAGCAISRLRTRWRTSSIAFQFLARPGRSTAAGRPGSRTSPERRPDLDFFPP